MSLKLASTKIEELPEEVRKFVTANDDGSLELDNEGIMKGLKAERVVSDDLRRKLGAFTESGLTADAVKAFAAFNVVGKS